LERAVQELGDRFADGDVPLPPFWGGFRLVPSCFEFWQGRESRLHDRLRYTVSGADAAWVIERLAP
ncbi:MAG: pyridoxine 5'-phosphate oxidase C-terminal domain-containing protein, partial [Candidatus Kapaibacterium sp.]